MELSNDLISQFVKMTKDDTKKKTETTVYGTIVEVDGSKYVQLDGSNSPTPISSTANANVGERVTVLIKNHTAIITGNMSSPSARNDDVEDIEADVADNINKIAEFEIAIANKVDTEELNAEKARIDNLVAENASIKGILSASNADIEDLVADTATINEKLNANAADIENLKTTKLDAEIADITYAKATDLEATNANVHNLHATYSEFEKSTIEDLEAIDAEIDNLGATYATIEQLNVEKGRIDDLEAEVGDIDTLIFGSATGSTIQASFANAVIAQLGNAQIKSAMIDSVAADKITSGDIITNNVRVMSEDGKLLISDETIQISDNTRVRVQIGKDADGDYSINIWDAEGKLMFSEGGITDSAIKKAIIRNDMVSDTANIAAHKLDIDSLFEEINGSTKTIKSARIYLDDEKQTLDVAFESMTTDIEELQNGVSSQGTAISVMQGQIASKVWQQDINTAVNEVNETTDNLSTQYEEVVQDVNGLTATVSNHTSEISKKADSSTVTEVNNKVASMETDLSGFKTTVSETYATKTEVDDISVGGTNLILNSTFDDDGNHWNVNTGKMTSYSFNKNDFGGHNSFEWSVTERTSSGLVGVSQHISIDKFKAGGRFILSGWAYVFTDVSVDANISVEIKRVTTSGDHIGFGTANLHDPSLPRDEWFYFEKEYNFPVEDTTEYYIFPWIGTNGHIKIAQLKLEAGTKATDWTPAPEDLATETEVSGLSNRMSVVETSITQHSTAIELRATKTELTEAIDDISVGGRNLILNSAEPINTTAPDDYNYQYLTFIPTVLPLAEGEPYTISADVEVLAGEVTIISVKLYNDTLGTQYAEVLPEIVNGHIEGTFEAVNAGASRVLLYAGIAGSTAGNSVTFSNIKFEKGNKATDWSPAPEDVNSAIETAQNTADDAQGTATHAEERASAAESLIQLLSDSIAMLVTDGNGQSLMTQTDTGWTFSTGELQSIVNSTSENLNDLTNEVGDIDSAVGILQQAVDDLGVLSEYVKITTYEGEPCIELGETDSDFKLLITNTRIMFMEGTGVPAYITNQALHIKKAVVEEELQQGEFVWKARSNGNLGLIWKGATS